MIVEYLFSSLYGINRVLEVTGVCGMFGVVDIKGISLGIVETGTSIFSSYQLKEKKNIFLVVF